MTSSEHIDRSAVSEVLSALRPSSWKVILLIFSSTTILHLGTLSVLPSLTGRVTIILTSFLIVQLVIAAYAGWKVREYVFTDTFLATLLYCVMFQLVHPIPPDIHTGYQFFMRALTCIILAAIVAIAAVVGRVIYLKRSPSQPLESEDPA